MLSRLLPASGPAPNAGQPDAARGTAYEGHLDCLVGTVLYGWCWKRPSDDRVPLRLDLDGRESGRAVASQFRTDLYAGAIGDGRHAFSIDLGGRPTCGTTRLCACSRRTAFSSFSGAARLWRSCALFNESAVIDRRQRTACRQGEAG